MTPQVPIIMKEEKLDFCVTLVVTSLVMQSARIPDGRAGDRINSETCSGNFCLDIFFSRELLETILLFTQLSRFTLSDSEFLDGLWVRKDLRSISDFSFLISRLLRVKFNVKC